MALDYGVLNRSINKQGRGAWVLSFMDTQAPSDVQHKWPSELVLIRHGQSERNVAKDAARLAGDKVSYVDAVRDQDTPLTAIGSGQALAIGVNLRSNPAYDIILVSPYLRTRQTAQLIMAGLGYKPDYFIDERLREIEFGLIDGLTAQGLAAKYPEELMRKRKEGKYWYRPPGGESRPDVALRVHSLLGTITREYTGKRVLVVCHSVVVLVFRRLLERWNEEQYMQVDRENDVKNCSLTTYEEEASTGRLRLKEYNQVFDATTWLLDGTEGIWDPSARITNGSSVNITITREVTPEKIIETELAT